MHNNCGNNAHTQCLKSNAYTVVSVYFQKLHDKKKEQSGL